MTDRLTREQVEKWRHTLLGMDEAKFPEKWQLEVLCDLALSALEGREKGLEVAAWLEEAADDIASWGAYASEYFQQKHQLDNCVALYKQRAASVVALRAPSRSTVSALGSDGGWIKTSEKLPDAYETVLVYHSDCDDVSGYHDDNGRWKTERGDYELWPHPTHWMKRPESPK